MITCYKCFSEKEDDDFSWTNRAKGKRNIWCRECMREYDKSRWQNGTDIKTRRTSQRQAIRKRNRQIVLDHFLANPCPCGENDHVVLEFDHREQSSKSGNVSEMMLYSTSKLKAEIAKCDVLCAHCHRRKTAKQFGWYT